MQKYSSPGKSASDVSDLAVDHYSSRLLYRIVAFGRTGIALLAESVLHLRINVLATTSA
jgi:hypothetical protein